MNKLIRTKKLIGMFLWRTFRYIKHNLIKWISFVILSLCSAMLILTTCTNISHRIPVLSFFASELKLPYTLELNSKIALTVKMENESLEQQKLPVKLSVGGYSVSGNSDENLELKFSSVEKTDIPIIITIYYGESPIEVIRYIDYSENQWDQNFEYEYLLGE